MAFTTIPYSIVTIGEMKLDIHWHSLCDDKLIESLNETECIRECHLAYGPDKPHKRLSTRCSIGQLRFRHPPKTNDSKSIQTASRHGDNQIRVFIQKRRF